jgi:hypothetical protein
MFWLTMWLGSSIFSAGAHVVSTYKAINDIEESGYKFNNDGISKLSNMIDEKNNSVNHLTMLIPGLNIYQALNRTKAYERNKEQIIERLEENDDIEELDEEDREEYSNPITRRINRIKKTLINFREQIYERIDRLYIGR